MESPFPICFIVAAKQTFQYSTKSTFSTTESPKVLNLHNLILLLHRRKSKQTNDAETQTRKCQPNRPLLSSSIETSNPVTQWVSALLSSLHWAAL